VAGTLVEAIVLGDGASASLADFLDSELRPNHRTVTVRAQVRPSTVAAPGRPPRVFLESSPDGSVWSVIGDIGEVREGVVKEANQAFPTGVDVRVRWEHEPDVDEENAAEFSRASWWLKLWLGSPPVAFR
jgi:hypothetical protein